MLSVRAVAMAHSKPGRAWRADEELLEFSRPFRVCNGTECDRIDLLCEALKKHLKLKAEHWIRQRGTEPIAVIYSSDCTPLTCKARYKSQVGGFVVRRQGRSCQEWLIERLVFLGCGRSTRIVCWDPRPMTDKTAWSHYQAQGEAWALPREQGHTDLVVHHHVWDRAVKAPCERMQRQRHAAHSSTMRAHMDEGEALWLDLL